MNVRLTLACFLGYCQLQSLYSNLLESMLMPRKGTVTRCNFVACNKVAPYYYWPTFHRSFAWCRSPLRPTTCPFDVRGVLFPASFSPRWRVGRDNMGTPTRDLLAYLLAHRQTDPEIKHVRQRRFYNSLLTAANKTMPLWSSIFQVPFFTRINIGTLAFLQLHTTFWICFILLLDQVEI